MLKAQASQEQLQWTQANDSKIHFETSKIVTKLCCVSLSNFCTLKYLPEQHQTKPFFFV